MTGMRILVWDVSTERATTWRFWRREWWERLRIGGTLAAIAIAAFVLSVGALLWLVSLVL